MSKSHNKKWFDNYDEKVDENKKRNWKYKRQARKMKAKIRRENLEYKEEEENDNNI